MLTVGRSARDLLLKKCTLAAWSKKKSFETVQICKNKRDTAGVFEEHFFTDNFDSLEAIEKMVVAVLASSSSCILSPLSSPLQ